MSTCSTDIAQNSNRRLHGNGMDRVYTAAEKRLRIWLDTGTPSPRSAPGPSGWEARKHVLACVSKSHSG